MSAYPPPTEDLPTFNPAVFFVDETGITLGEADARYLKLSGGVMTGTLAVPSITLNGSNLETDITNLQNKTQDLTFSGNTSTFSGNIEATGNIYVSGNNKFIGVDNGTSSIEIKNHANHADFEVVNPDNAIHFKNAGVELFDLTNAETLFYKPLKANTSVDIGDGTTRFNTIYASTLNLPTISDVGSQISTNTSNISTLQTKTTQLSYDSGTTTSTFGGSTLDVNATLALPLHANVDSTLTTIEGNITTLQTKTTGITYDSGTSKTTISNISTSNDIEIRESNINFNRNDGSGAGVIQYQSEGLTIKETRGGNNTTVIIGGADIDFKTGASGTDNKVSIPDDVQPTLNIGVDGGERGAKIQMEGVEGDVGLDHCVLETRQFDGIDKSELVIFKGNDQAGPNTDRIRLRAGQLAFDCYNGNSTDRTAEDIRATMDDDSFNIFSSVEIDSNGLSILTDYSISSESVDTGADVWAVKIPIICSLTKTISNTNNTQIRLPKNVGNYSGNPSNGAVWLINVSRNDSDWLAGDNPSLLGVLQLSTFATKKGKFYEITGPTNDIFNLFLTESGSEIIMNLRVNCSFPTSCAITLTQLR